MNISTMNNLMFFHIPKNAGVSVINAFKMEKVKELHRTTVCGLDYEFIIDNIDDTNQTREWLLSLTKFAIIRNPYDRLVSLYHFRKKENDLYNLYSGANPKGGDKTTPEGTELSFKEWVMDKRTIGVGFLWDEGFLEIFTSFTKEKEIYLWKNHHVQHGSLLEWINQIHFITDSNGNLVVDDILRFENLDENIKNFCKKYNLKEVMLPKKNGSPRKKNYIDYYDDELIEFVSRIYADDLKFFNYKFGD